MFLFLETTLTPFLQIMRVECFPIVLDTILERVRYTPLATLIVGCRERDMQIKIICDKDLRLKGVRR